LDHHSSSKRSSSSDYSSISPTPCSHRPILTAEQSALTKQIVNETCDAVISKLRGWTIFDYNCFIEGLISVGDERDRNLKCKIIQEQYLPHLSFDDIQMCYSLLQNASRKDNSRNSQMILNQSQIPNQMIHPESMMNNVINLTMLENDAKRTRIYSSPIPDVHPQFTPIPFVGNMNEAVALRFAYPNPYVRFPIYVPPSFHSSDNQYFSQLLDGNNQNFDGSNNRISSPSNPISTNVNNQINSNINPSHVSLQMDPFSLSHENFINSQSSQVKREYPH